MKFGSDIRQANNQSFNTQVKTVLRVERSDIPSR